MSNYSITKACTSQSYAYKLWYNFYYQQNSLQIVPEDRDKILATWSDELSTWTRIAAEYDENSYDFEDEDFENFKAAGEDMMIDATGYDGETGGAIGRTIATNAAAVVTGGEATGRFVIQGGKKIWEGAKNLGDKIKNIGSSTNSTSSSLSTINPNRAQATIKPNNNEVSQVGGEAGKGTWKDWMLRVSAGIAIAQAALYYAKKPNKDAKEACDELVDEMANSNSALTQAQSEMAEAEQRLIELTEEATTTNEDANNTMLDSKTYYDFYKASYDALKAKAASGEPLTESEKALFQSLIPLMEEAGTEIQETSESTTETVAGIHDDIGSWQTTYDMSVETIGQVQGITDFAASFDETTQKLCYTESVTQSLNGANGVWTGGKLLAQGIATGWTGIGILDMALGSLAIVAGGSSIYAATEQISWAGQVGNEIAMREGVQDFNSTTTDIFNDSYEVYNGEMQFVEGLELLVPEDTDAPTDNTLAYGGNGTPTNNSNGTSPTSGTTIIGGTTSTDGANTTGGTTSTGGTNSSSGTNNNSVPEQVPKNGGTADKTYNKYMGYGSNYTQILTGNVEAGKVILDNENKVVLSREYVDVLHKVFGTNAENQNDGKFNTEKIPTVIAKLLNSPFTEEVIKKVHKGDQLDSTVDANVIKTITGKDSGIEQEVDNSKQATVLCKKVVDFYWPIFNTAATNGWTSKYADQLMTNSDVIDSGIMNDKFKLSVVKQ